jgi:Tfp pilus assembly protein PilF
MRKAVLLILPLCLAACGGGGNNSPAPPPPAVNQPAAPKVDHAAARKLFDEAGELSLKGDNSRAAEKLEKAVKLDPGDGEIHARLAFVYAQLLRYEDARDEYVAAANLESGYIRQQMNGKAAQCALRLAIQAANKNDYAAALPDAKQAVDLAPGYREALVQLGKIQFKLKQYADSAETYARVLTISSGEQRYEALAGIGQGQFYAEQYEKAAATYSKLIKEGVRGYEAYGWRAYCDYKLGRLDDAQKDFQLAAEHTKDPDKRAEYEEALRQFEGRK